MRVYERRREMTHCERGHPFSGDNLYEYQGRRRCKACRRLYQSDHRRRHLLRKYAMTPEAFEVMLDAQGGGCAICGKRPGSRALHVDHDHASGEVRGILCNGCNVRLAALDDRSWLARAFQYLGRTAPIS